MRTPSPITDQSNAPSAEVDTTLTLATNYLYSKLAGRDIGAPVDCGACGRRHERDAVAAIRPSRRDPVLVVAALCSECAGDGTAGELRRAELAMAARRPMVWPHVLPDLAALVILVDPDCEAGQ